MCCLTRVLCLYVGAAKFSGSVPYRDISKVPRYVYFHRDVEECGESGESELDREKIPDHVYLAINLTSERVYPVEVVKPFVY